MYVFCEGQTEQGFCNQALRPHLFPDGDGIVHTLAVGEKNNRHVYGIGRHSKYERVRKFIHNTIKFRQGKNVYFTTLFDLYALPDGFPGRADNVRDPANPAPYVLALQHAFEKDIDYHRFIAHLQLYEYETMLFAEPESFRIAFEDCDTEVEQLKAIAASFPSIEHIDDGRQTAPSKRIIAVIPAYAGRKSTAGPDIAEFIGVAKIRAACPHFHRWLDRLENIPWDSE
ncbi:DUF4276 family protein [Singulisphaera rosea]